METNQLPRIEVLSSPNWRDFELLDSGDGETLVRVGPHKLIRPEPQAIWSKALPKAEWKAVDAIMIPTSGEHGGYWQFNKTIPESWVIDYKGLKSEIQLSTSRHIGIFPEQANHWDWIEEQVGSAKGPIKVINLFGYTGMATAAAARAGARVTHVDAAKQAVNWASRNLELSGLGDAPVRREAKRKSYYDGIILDPPKFGRGPAGSVWEYFKDISELLDLCKRVLTPQPRFICLTSYAIQASALVLHEALGDMVKGLGGTLSCGELVTVEKSRGRILSHALFGRWCAD